ncbi:hypothetical protein C0991_006970 [Blastosporella zonata]|nr:hypothetical protein C0991_006970 [Blastosporella zonata]
MRGYGLTKGHIKQEVYCPTDSADDVYRFLVSNLNAAAACFHLAGRSAHACSFVSRKRSTCPPCTYLGSPSDVVWPISLPALPIQILMTFYQPEDIASGRLEVFNLWVQAFNHDGHEPPSGDHATLEDLTLGIQQLCFNNEKTTLTEALSKNSLVTATQNRAGSPQAVKDSYHATVGWFLKRRPPTREALAKDVAYSVEHAEELEYRLRDAGVTDIELIEVPGPHYGSVVNPQAVGNSPMNENQTQHALGECRKMTTPFTTRLAEYGYDPNEDEDDYDFDDC